eukprot:scaffold2536_cov378-Prasinococcus_capsulatus_cf.AAC.4
MLRCPAAGLLAGPLRAPGWTGSAREKPRTGGHVSHGFTPLTGPGPCSPAIARRCDAAVRPAKKLRAARRRRRRATGDDEARRSWVVRRCIAFGGVKGFPSAAPPVLRAYSSSAWGASGRGGKGGALVQPVSIYNVQGPRLGRSHERVHAWLWPGVACSGFVSVGQPNGYEAALRPASSYAY